ncbi:MAG: hypothetical protein L0271_13310, partial [Gemmatimonadetes bacterium]|nr:hypothetical protein [Gemmatimonadota bacterium]
AMPWPCPVSFGYADENLGCSGRLVSGIESVFAETDEAIFLEDDVLPAASFFGFCDELLSVYRRQPEVMMISGVNPLDEWPAGEAAHLFSKLGHAQAWASWKRAWERFPDARDAWGDERVRSRIRGFLADEDQFRARSAIYALPAGSAGHSWDYQWALARQMHGGLTAVPAKGLAVHAGRGALATHTRQPSIAAALARPHEAEFPIRCPGEIAPDAAYDRFLFEVTNDCLSAETAMQLARMLAERSRKLLAVAVLRHRFASRWREAAAEIDLAIPVQAGGGASG